MESKGRRMGHRGREREIIAQGLNTSPDDKKKKNMSSSLTHREIWPMHGGREGTEPCDRSRGEGTMRSHGARGIGWGVGAGEGRSEPDGGHGIARGAVLSSTGTEPGEGRSEPDRGLEVARGAEALGASIEAEEGMLEPKERVRRLEAEKGMSRGHTGGRGIKCNRASADRGRRSESG